MIDALDALKFIAVFFVIAPLAVVIAGAVIAQIGKRS